MCNQLCSNNCKSCISIFLFSSSFTTFIFFMFCYVCNMDFGSTYNLVFLTANIILMGLFFTCIVQYCYKSRSKNIYYDTPIESHLLVGVL